MVMCNINAQKGTIPGTIDLWPSLVHLWYRLIIVSENTEDNEKSLKLFSQPDINCKLSQLNVKKHVAWGLPFSFLRDYNIQLEIYNSNSEHVDMSWNTNTLAEHIIFKADEEDQQPVTDHRWEQIFLLHASKKEEFNVYC